MKGDTLTPKQERFTNLIFQGISQRQAWIDAGYSSSYDNAIIDTHASQLAALDKVKVRLKELQDAVSQTNIGTVTDRKQRLTKIYSSDFEFKDIKPRDITLAIQEHNKMDGVYKETTLVDARTFNIVVGSEEEKLLLEQANERVGGDDGQEDSSEDKEKGTETA